MTRSRPARLLLGLALLVLGAVVGLASVAIHGRTPGLVLAVAATGAAAYALPAGALTRLPYAVGWVVLVGYATVPRPEGDYVIARNVQGYGLLVAALVLLLFAVATLRPRHRVPAEAPEPAA